MPRRDPSQYGVQLDLFQPASREPGWGSLPLEVREQARRLLAQMLRRSALQGGAVESQRAAGDE